MSNNTNNSNSKRMEDLTHPFYNRISSSSITMPSSHRENSDATNSNSINSSNRSNNSSTSMLSTSNSNDCQRLFHLQQELLRQELPDQRSYQEIQRNQSQRLEQYLMLEREQQQQQQQLMWHQQQQMERQMQQQMQQQLREQQMQLKHQLQQRDGRHSNDNIAAQHGRGGDWEAQAASSRTRSNSTSNIASTTNSNSGRGSSNTSNFDQQRRQLAANSTSFDQQRRQLAALRDSIRAERRTGGSGSNYSADSYNSRENSDGNNNGMTMNKMNSTSSPDEPPLCLPSKHQMMKELQLLHQQLQPQQHQQQSQNTYDGMGSMTPTPIPLSNSVGSTVTHMNKMNDSSSCMMKRPYSSFTMGSDHNNNNNNGGGANNRSSNVMGFEPAMKMTHTNASNSNLNSVNNNCINDSSFVPTRRSYHDGMQQHHPHQHDRQQSNRNNNSFQRSNHSQLMPSSSSFHASPNNEMMAPPLPPQEPMMNHTTNNINNNNSYEVAMRRCDFYNDQVSMEQGIMNSTTNNTTNHSSNTNNSSTNSFAGNHGSSSNNGMNSMNDSNKKSFGEPSRFVAKRRNSIYVPAATARKNAHMYDVDQHQQLQLSRDQHQPSMTQQQQQQQRPNPNLSPCTLRLQSQAFYQDSTTTDNNVGVKDSLLASREQQASGQQGSITSTTGAITNHYSRPSSATDILPSEQSTDNSMMKRRKLASSTNDMLLLEMLNDTVVSPAAPAKPSISIQASSKNDDESNKSGVSGMMNNAYSNNFDSKPAPIQVNHDEPFSPLLTQTHIQGIAQSMLMGGNTPTMFADLFLRTPTNASNNNNVVDNMSAIIPPPPLVNMMMMSSSSSDTRTAASSSFLMDDNAPLPLPPVKKSDNKRGNNKKGRKGSKGSKKNKDGGTNSGSGSGGGGGGSTTDTSNHIVTPSSAIISALSQEIRTKMMQEDQKEPSGDTLQESNKSNRSSSDATTSCESSDIDTFSIPQFASAMEASQASQQSIHDWDRKFGLRRAHSKTMRESCRSRKRVLEFLRGEGANILLLKKSLLSMSSTSSSLNNNKKKSESSASVSSSGLKVKAGSSQALLVSHGEEERNAMDDSKPFEHAQMEVPDKEEELESQKEAVCEEKEEEELSLQARGQEDSTSMLPHSSSTPSPLQQADDNTLEDTLNKYESIVPEDQQALDDTAPLPNDPSDTDEQEELDSSPDQKASSQSAKCHDQLYKRAGSLHSSHSSHSSKLSDDHVELERMFRRASLDCVEAMLPTGLRRPLPQESGFKQFHAKSA